MYLWVILTTFLAMLAAYALPIRPDAQEAVTVPVAQARLIQMVVKQSAGVQFMKENAYPYYSTEQERKVNYTSGQISDEQLDDYMTFGYVNSQDYVTAIYCMDEDLTEIRTGDDACRKTDTEKTQRLLITYGAIPERWQMITEDGDIMPSPDMTQAMRQQFGLTDIAGYVINEGGTLYVVNYEGTRFEVPQPVADNTNMMHYGLKDCLNDYGTCLAYMSWR